MRNYPDEREEAAQSLRTTEERLALAISAARLGTWDWDIRSNQIVWSPRCLELFGMTPDTQISYEKFLAAVHPADRAGVETQIRAALEGRADYELEIRVVWPDSSVHWLTVRGRAYYDDSGTAFRMSGVAAEITTRKDAEVRLARDFEAVSKLNQVGSLFVREGNLQAVLEQIVEAAISISRADFGNVQLLDPSSGLRIAAHRGFPAWYLDFWNEVTAGHGSCRTALASGGRVIVSDVEQSPIFAGTAGLEMQRRAGVRAVQSTPIISRSGKRLGMLSTHFKKPHEPDDHALKLLDLLAHQTADIIERAHYERTLTAAKEELARANVGLEKRVRERTAKLQETITELEGFSYSLVHDMRAPLRAMVSFAGILEMEAGPRLRPDEAEMLRRISVAAGRMDQLVRDSLDYSKILRADLPLAPINLGELLRGMVETYPNLHSPQADVSIEVVELWVHGNEAALTQIFSNLLGNAVKFVALGVRPRVRVWAEVRHCPGSFKNSADCAFVWIEDNGIGIPKEAHERIFGMFNRLHRAEDYPGTGIGLALVRKSLERIGGQITLESEPGQGSRFCVQLALAREHLRDIAA